MYFCFVSDVLKQIIALLALFVFDSDRKIVRLVFGVIFYLAFLSYGIIPH